MRDVLPFLLDHGYAVVFLCVLAEQAGAPFPATPVLLGIGALAGLDRMSLVPPLLLSVLACLIADSVWYGLGRKRGGSILRLLCAISLEPDSCVNTTKRTFAKLGPSALLFAKFVPGLSTAAPPMAGVNRMPLWRFLLADTVGSLIWSGSFIGAGWIFRHQIEVIAEHILAFGSRAGLFIALLLAAWVLFKYWQRERFIRSLRSARIGVDELYSRLQEGEEFTILDLRHRLEMEASGTVLPGARWYDSKQLEDHHHEIPRDRDIILYCS